MLTARLGLLLFTRSGHTVKDIFRNAKIRDLRRDQTLEKTLENKIHKYFLMEGNPNRKNPENCSTVKITYLENLYVYGNRRPRKYDCAAIFFYKVECQY